MGRRLFHPVPRALALAGVAALAALGLGVLPAHAAPAAIPAGSIQVLDADGVPVEGAVVVLSPAGGSFTEFPAAAGADGILDLTTVAGFDPAANPYVVWVDADGYAGYWDKAPGQDTTTPLQISSGGPLVVADIPTSNPPPDANSAGISGTVTDALTGEPLLGTMVSAADDSTGGDGAGAGQTKLDGTYYLNYSGSELPSTVSVTFDTYEVNESAPYGYAGQFYDGIDQDSLRVETPVPVAAGQTTTGIDAKLMPNGQISGVVSEAGPGGGTPLANVEVSVWNIEHAAVVEGGPTDSEGRYRVHVAPGDYIVQFQKIVDGNPGDSLYFNGASTYASATPVTVVTRENVEINAQFGAAPPPTPSQAPSATGSPAPALAESGAENSWPVAAGGLVALLTGGAALVFHRRRIPQRNRR